MIPKFATENATSVCELRNRDTRVMALSRWGAMTTARLRRVFPRVLGLRTLSRARAPNVGRLAPLLLEFRLFAVCGAEFVAPEPAVTGAVRFALERLAAEAALRSRVLVGMQHELSGLTFPVAARRNRGVPVCR